MRWRWQGSKTASGWTKVPGRPRLHQNMGNTQVSFQPPWREGGWRFSSIANSWWFNQTLLCNEASMNSQIGSKSFLVDKHTGSKEGMEALASPSITQVPLAKWLLLSAVGCHKPIRTSKCFPELCEPFQRITQAKREQPSQTEAR